VFKTFWERVEDALSKSLMSDALFNITDETRLIGEVRDILDELTIISVCVHEQKEVHEYMHGLYGLKAPILGVATARMELTIAKRKSEVDREYQEVGPGYRADLLREYC